MSGSCKYINLNRPYILVIYITKAAFGNINANCCLM